MCVVLVFKSANFPSTSTRQSDTGLSGLIASKNDGQFFPLQEFSTRDKLGKFYADSESN